MNEMVQPELVPRSSVNSQKVSALARCPGTEAPERIGGHAHAIVVQKAPWPCRKTTVRVLLGTHNTRVRTQNKAHSPAALNNHQLNPRDIQPPTVNCSCPANTTHITAPHHIITTMKSKRNRKILRYAICCSGACMGCLAQSLYLVL